MGRGYPKSRTGTIHGLCCDAAVARGEERCVDYTGQPPGAFSFFTSFPTILFRCSGSVLVNVWVETVLAVGLSVVAVLLNKYVYENPEEIKMTGHQVFGVLIAFLVVFRSQIAWGMYMEGRSHLGVVISTTRALGLELVSTLCAGQISIEHQVMAAKRNQRSRSRFRTLNAEHKLVRLSSSLPRPASPESSAHESPGSFRDSTVDFSADNLLLAEEVVRMLKLFYFCMVEHLRSTESTAVWRCAYEKTKQYATPAEFAELLEEYGGVQEHNRRHKVTRTFHFDRYSGEDHVSIGVEQDPTRSKPLIVLSWVRMTLERGVIEGLLRDTQLHAMWGGLSALVSALGGLHKIDTLVLPFPYAQLLHWTLLIFCFTLPFVMASELEWWTVPIAAGTTCTFYGLTEIGAELEQPFGVDPNDFPLLRMGEGLSEDLDAMLRTANVQRISARHGGHHTSREEDNVTGWPPTASTDEIQPIKVWVVPPVQSQPTRAHGQTCNESYAQVSDAV